MTPERWRQVEDIFQAALNLNTEERARYMSVACGGDAELRRDVESLLQQHESGGGRTFSVDPEVLESLEEIEIPSWGYASACIQLNVKSGAAEWGQFMKPTASIRNSTCAWPLSWSNVHGY